MSGLITFFSNTLGHFWTFLTSVRFINGPNLLQIVIAGLFTWLTFALLFNFGRGGHT